MIEYLMTFIFIGVLLYILVGFGSHRSYDGEMGGSIISYGIGSMVIILIGFAVVLPIFSSLFSQMFNDPSSLSDTDNFFKDFTSLPVNWNLLAVACLIIIAIVITYYMVRWLVRSIDWSKSRENRNQKVIVHQLKKEKEKKVSGSDFGYNQHRLLYDQNRKEDVSKINNVEGKQPVVSGWKPKGDVKEKKDGRTLEIK